jgi:hypothetical protein
MKQQPVEMVVWENFGNGQNRKLNTFDKKEVILQEEMGNKRVIEEYVEDKSSLHMSKGSIKDTGSQLFNLNLNLPLPTLNTVGVSMQDINNNHDHTLASYHGS